MRKVVIASAARTPIGKFGGSFRSLSAVDLGVVAAKEAIKRAKIDPSMIDEVIIGNVISAGLGQNVARQVSVGAGVPIEVPAMTINLVCNSGLRAVSMAAQMIACGDNEIVLCGGCESMTNAPYIDPNERWGKGMNDSTHFDSIIHDGLQDVFYDIHAGVTAENIAEQYGISREEQDRLALESQLRAEKALKENKFDEEIVPVVVPLSDGETIVVEKDEYPRANSSLERLAKLPAPFKKGGTVTAGNSSGLNDGAAAIVVMSKEKADELGIEYLAEIVAYGTAGVDPRIMGTGPIPAVQKALKKANWSVEELDLVEANEAFAAQVLAVARELKLKPEITNVNGGSIALGHPLGSSGARILTTLLYEMKRRNAKKGLATLCAGGGLGTAVLVER